MAEGVRVRVGDRVTLWKRGVPTKGSRVGAASSGQRMMSRSEGPGAVVEAKLVTQPPCQEGGGCRVAWRLLVTTDHREVSGPSLTAWTLKDFDELNPGRVA